MQEDLCAFTVRIPRALRDQIDARAKIHRRKRNGEINILLEHAIDAMVGSDLKVLRKNVGSSQNE